MSPLCLGDGALESLDVMGNGPGSQRPWGERSPRHQLLPIYLGPPTSVVLHVCGLPEA